MIRTLWFFTQITILIGGAVWLATQPGSVAISMFDYDIRVDAGVFVITLLTFLLMTLFILNLIRKFFSIPTVIAKYRKEDRRKRGFRALTRGLVSVAAGDAKRATQFSKQTKILLPNQNGLPVLLEAQAARLRGEEGLAQNRFQELMKDKDAAFLGIRGLLKSALDEGNIIRALDFARQAEKIHSKQGWILQTVYDLEIKNGLWSDALKTGKKALKYNAMPLNKITSDRVAIHLMRSDYEFAKGSAKLGLKELDQAYKLNPNFIPTVTRLARFYLGKNKKRKVTAMVEAAWKKNPHPDLANIWDELAPIKNGKNSDKILRWYETLIALKPESAEGQMTAARAAMDLGFWGEAKAYLMVAEKIYPSAKLFRLRAIVEQNSTHNEDAISELMERAADALPNKTWICTQTGMTYPEWSAIAMPHESFNSIIWDYPGARIIKQQQLGSGLAQGALLIDPAA